MKDTELEYKTGLAKHLNAAPDNIFLYWKGRVALYALLQAMGVGENDEVILPAFTCVVVPNAILYLKARPVYVDIDPLTYNMDVEKMEAAITPKTKVLISQNTFGFSSNVEKICEIARRHQLLTIEDCTHGFGGTYKGQPNGTYCDAAFFSTQWNKPFSTGIGGFALVSKTDLKTKLESVNSTLEPTTIKDTLSLSILYFVREKILTEKRYWRMVKLYRWLSKYKLVQGSSSGIEIETAQMPSHYFKGMSTAQMKKGIANLAHLDAMLSLRKSNAAIYSEYLKSKGKTFVPVEQFPDHSFLKYPFLVEERATVMRLAEEDKIPLGEWFCSPLHPVGHHFEQWHLNPDDFPNAKYAAERMLNLPTDIKNAQRVLDFLDKTGQWIL